MESDPAPREPELPPPSASASPLSGTLEDTTPAGVLQVLSSQHHTGAVRFSGDSGCTVYLHEGELYFAETIDTGEDLAVALVRPGRLNADEWDRSTSAGYPNETVGEALIQTGSISRELLASVLLSIIYDPLIELFRAPEGEFSFEPGVIHWIGPFRTFGVDAIVAEVRRRTREADEMAPVLPSLDTVVRSTRSLPSDRPSVNLRRDDWEIVVAAAQGRTVAELAVDLGRGRWSTARLVYRLIAVNLLDVLAPDGTTTPPTDALAVNNGSPTAPDESATATHFDPTALDDATTRSFDASPPPLDPTDFAAPTPDPDDAHDTTGWPEATTDGSTWGTPSADPAIAPTGGDPVAPDTSGWDDPSWEAPTSTPLSGEPADAAPVFEPPALHPDIAKALAESTYADSATAINAMAARLGAADADEEDDTWPAAESASAVGDEASAFWSSDSDDSSFPWDGNGNPRTDDQEFTWEPAVWDTGGEAPPLPQREHAELDPEARMSGPAGSSDPQWLETLYSQFMPKQDAPNAGNGPTSVEQAFGADPGAAPKVKTLRRLMSAIRRL